MYIEICMVSVWDNTNLQIFSGNDASCMQQKVWIDNVLAEAVHKSQMWFNKTAIKFIYWVNPDSAKSLTKS